MTKYVKNPEGGVQSVTDEHYEQRLHTTVAGRSYLKPGWEDVSPAAAKKANPSLFGAPDPQVTFTDDELVRAARRKKLLAELFSDAPSTDDGDVDDPTIADQ